MTPSHFTTMTDLSLRQRQVLFARCLAKLVLYAESKGWEVTLAEGYIGDSINKPSEDTPHLRTGTHFLRLGQDINLFVNGVWETKICEEYRMLGAFWKALDPLCFWGGDLPKLDVNHFSVRWGTAA